MHPGALSMQYAACQKPGCACVDPVKPKKHRPFYQLRPDLARRKDDEKWRRNRYSQESVIFDANASNLRNIAGEIISLSALYPSS
jgi:hypothetical protein